MALFQVGFDWKSRLFDAKFGDAKFSVFSVDTGIGRRNVVHQYPSLGEEGNATFVEDLGQDADEFVIEAFIIQKPPFYNYIKDRDVLIKALKKPGVHVLTHPFYGKKNVAVVGKVRVKESFQEGGIARFTMTLVESIPDPRFPQVGTLDSLDKNWQDSINRLLDGFASFYEAGLAIADDIEDLLDSVRSTVTAVQRTFGIAISTATGIIDSAKSAVDSALSSSCTIGNTISDGFDGFMNAAGKFQDTSLLAALGPCSGRPQPTEERIDSSTSGVIGFNIPTGVSVSSSVNPNDSIPKLLGMSLVMNGLTFMTFGDDTATTSSTGSTAAEEAGVVAGTASGISNSDVLPVSDTEAQKAANQLTLVNFARCMMLIQLARIAIDIAYDNLDDLQTIQTAMLDAIDAMLDKMGDEASSDDYGDFGITTASDAFYEILKQLRPQLTQALEERGSDLSSLIEFEVPPGVSNTLTLAYDRYEDLKRSIELRERNRVSVKHPGFLPEGEDIKILSA